MQWHGGIRRKLLFIAFVVIFARVAVVSNSNQYDVMKIRMNFLVSLFHYKTTRKRMLNKWEIISYSCVVGAFIVSTC